MKAATDSDSSFAREGRLRVRRSSNYCALSVQEMLRFIIMASTQLKLKVHLLRDGASPLPLVGRWSAHDLEHRLGVGVGRRRAVGQRQPLPRTGALWQK